MTINNLEYGFIDQEGHLIHDRSEFIITRLRHLEIINGRSCSFIQSGHNDKELIKKFYERRINLI